MAAQGSAMARNLQDEHYEDGMLDGQEVMDQNDDEAYYPRGTVFIEVQIPADMNEMEVVEDVLGVFEREAEDGYLTLWEEILTSDMYGPFFDGSEFVSIKAVEYIGKELSGTSIPIKDVDIEIHVYRTFSSFEPLVEFGTLLQGDAIALPHMVFEGLWERLIFEKDIREILVRLITNMLKISTALSISSRQAGMNRLILLAGPPGTGKTTLSKALAQKLSIRFNRQFTTTTLIPINAANLLSKFFSESAKCILQIFTSIERVCRADPTQFVCVLIDEVESIASSRKMASNHGEVQDAIRATNALLMGFDRVRSQHNLIILCTSNMVETLDAAFLDRCGYQIVVEAPSVTARYHILKDGVQDLINAGIITTLDRKGVPSYRDAQLALLTEPKKPGSILIQLCQMLDSSINHNGMGNRKCSARYLGQLPEVALAERLVSDSCTLDQALKIMVRFVEEQERVQQGEKRKIADDDHHKLHQESKMMTMSTKKHKPKE